MFDGTVPSLIRKGRRDALLGKLQERYDIGREAAERQLEEWVRGMEDQAGAGTKAAECPCI
jgi:hypothetical protein